MLACKTIATLFFLTVYVLIFAVVPNAVAQDSGLVRVQVDLDGTSVSINGSEISQDSFGNSLEAKQWFILKLPVGEYRFVLSHIEYSPFKELVTVYKDRVTNLHRFFVDTEKAVPVDTLPEVVSIVKVLTDPDSAVVVLDGTADTLLAPCEVELSIGKHELSALSDGFEELSHQLNITGADPVTLLFNLEFQQPERLTAEDLGLVKEQPIILGREEEATMIKAKYNSLAESFAIIPLGQGLLARFVMGDDVSKESNALIISGVLLTGGAYLLGKVLSERKLREIQAFNEVAIRKNIEIKEGNKVIDKLVDEQNATLIAKWLSDNRDRGRVIVQTK